MQGWNSSGGVISIAANAPVTITPQNSSQPALAVKGAASQTANLQEWQNSAGTAVLKIGADGSVRGNGTFGAWGGAYSQFDTNGNPTFKYLMGYNVTAGGYYTEPSEVKLTVKAANLQTADLQQWQNVNGIVFAKVDASGNIGVGAGTTALTYGLDIFTGSARIWNGVTGAGQTGTLYLGDGSLTKAYGSGWAFAGGLVTTGGYGISSNGNLDAGGTTLGYGRLSVNTGTTTTTIG